MSINGMGEFGFNIKKYQQMTKAQFGQLTNGRSSGISGNTGNFQLNESIFKMSTGAGNPFRSKQSRMERMGGYDANAIAMLNQMQQQQNTQQTQSQNTQKSPSWKEVGNAWKDAFKAYDEAFGKGSKTEGTQQTQSGSPTQNTPKSGDAKPSETVNDIKNAEDRETLTNAIDGAKGEQQTVQTQEKKVDQQAKAADSEVSQTAQDAQQTQQTLDQSTETLKQNEQNLSQAKTEVQTCTDNYSAAQTKTAGCKQALADAKAAATEDNPNTAAIKQAEANLKSAEAEEEKAKQALESAKQKETEAQAAVDKSKEEVQTATTENTKAQEAAKAAEANSAEVQAEQTEVKQQSTELESGIAEGEQRLEQMTNENSNVDTGTNSSLGEETSSGNVESTGGTESDLQSIREEKARIAEEYANNPAYADAKLEDDPYYTQLSMQEESLSSGDTSVKADSAGSAESPQSSSLFDSQTDLINNGNYSADEKQQMFEAREQIMSMEPGDMIMVGDMTYEMDAEGNITQKNSNGRVVGEYQGDEYGAGKESAAMNAADQFKDKFDARNQSDLEMQALRSGSENDEEKIKKAKKKGDAK